MKRNVNSFDKEFWIRENYFAISNLIGKQYLDRRIKDSGFDWSKSPSIGAIKAVKQLHKYKVRSILDIGCGYGRDCIYFAINGFDVTGIDYSELAIYTAKELYKSQISDIKKTIKSKNLKLKLGKAKFICTDFSDYNIKNKKYDAVFSFKTFHQFRHINNSIDISSKYFPTAQIMMDKMNHCVNNNGLIIICTFSTQDYYCPPIYIDGNLSNENRKYKEGCKYIDDFTFDSRLYRPVSFYTKNHMDKLFNGLKVIYTEHIFDEENHKPDGNHIHAYWFFTAKTKKAII